MITLDAVGKSHGSTRLFGDVSLQVLPGRRIALVGPNGAGKTTLLRMMIGEDAPDEGAVTRTKDLTIGYVRQEVAETRGRSVLAEVLAGAEEVTALEADMRRLEHESADADPGPERDRVLADYGHAHDRFEHLGGYRVEAEARRLLAGLGFAEDDADRDVGELSGGWMMRVALARVLIARPDLLLLDEPTNHLDLMSVTWLERFLNDHDGALVLVSHDRDFIEGVANRVVELAGGTATEYAGTFSDFVEARELRREQQANAARNQARRVAQVERFVERFRYKQSLATRVQSRVKMLDKMERIDAPEAEAKGPGFSFPDPPRAGRTVVELAAAGKSYGDTVVYDGLDFALERGMKAALVGPNGAGKSTLLKLIAGAFPPDSGERRLGHNVRCQYYAQHQIDALDLDGSVLENFRVSVGDDPEWRSRNPRTFLGAFGFTGDDAHKPVGVLSGGERARLALARVMARPANLLCLDEPTNHLDMPSRDVLEDALDEYPGAIVLITHDRHLIRSIAGHLVDVRGGRAQLVEGGWDDHAVRLGLETEVASRRAEPEPDPEPTKAPPAAARAPRTKQRKRDEAEARNTRFQRTKDLKAKVRAAERDLAATEAEVADLQRRMAEPEVYDDPDEIKRLSIAHDEAKDRADRLMEAWERASTALERADRTG